MNTFRVHQQASAYESPWPLRARVQVLLWQLCWAALCAWTPKPFNGWRLFWLRRFGATLHGAPFVHGRAVVVRPWNLTLRERACLGRRRRRLLPGPRRAWRRRNARAGGLPVHGHA